ncbi:MAG TPA: alpha/beta hydrolase [Ramlibacter sp.]|jgi:phospholipase/carboxylesterase
MPALETIEAESGPDPVATLIILHGLGADGNDFVPIAQELDLEAVGPVRFIFPHAPVIPVTVNGGYRMRAWYDLLGTEARNIQDGPGLRRSQAVIEALLQREEERGIAPERIVLAGFSQGCAIALMTGLRYPRRLGGIVGLSGYLPLAQETAAERSAASQQTPIFLAHGWQDETIELHRAEQSAEALRALGYDVDWHDYPIGHSVCMEEIHDLNRFLVRVLAR